MSLTQLYDFHGKTALITGASGGLPATPIGFAVASGEQFARCLHARGARVLLASRRDDKLNDLSDELSNAKAIKMDVADKNSVVSYFAELEKAGEKIDICINNAGIAKLTPIFEEEQQKEFANLIPLGFVADPQDLDSALMFLAQNEHSAYMTGTNITVDGGKSCLSAVASAKAEGVTSW